MAGKGSRQRPTDTAKFSSGYDRIFGNKSVQTDVTLEHEPGMSTSCLDCPEPYKGTANKHIEGDEATNE